VVYLLDSALVCEQLSRQFFAFGQAFFAKPDWVAGVSCPESMPATSEGSFAEPEPQRLFCHREPDVFASLRAMQVNL
jgi:hypothetical protein